MAHTFSGISLSHIRNEIELSVVRWMDLESVTQSEVSQKEKDKYRMLTYTWNLRKTKCHEEPRGKTGIKTQTY